jgi:hypothetical protein
MINATSHDSYNRTNQPTQASEPSNSSMQTHEQCTARMTSVEPTADHCDWRTAAGTTVSTPVLTTTTSSTLTTLTTLTTTSTNTQTTTGTSRTARAPFSMAEMEKEWSTIITLRNRASNQPAILSQPALMNQLPGEIKFHIFQQLPHTALFDRSLFALACTSTDWRAEMKKFFTPDRVCIAFGGKVLRKEVLELWQAEGKKLREQTAQLREDFEQSRQPIRLACQDKLSVDELWQSVSDLSGIEINFKDIRNVTKIMSIVDKLDDQTIKFSASGMARNNFMKEVLPVLSKIPAGCRVVLEATHNNLQPDDVQQLIMIMKANPCIVQLNLSGNALCHGNQISTCIVELFHTPSPLTHLYLNAIDLNDETAIALSEPLATNPCLRHLDLRKNHLTQDAALALINAVATTDSTGAVHTNTVLNALRLQGNQYGQENKIIFTALEEALHLVAKTKADYDPDALEYPYIIQVDGVTGGISQFPSMRDMYMNSFRREAEAEKL